LPRFEAEVVATFSLPSFKDNFDTQNGIAKNDLAKSHSEAIKKFLDAI